MTILSVRALACQPLVGLSIVLSADQLGASQLLPPLTDITYHSGWLYITHRQVGANGWTVGAVSRFNPSDPVGTFQTLSLIHISEPTRPY